MVRKDLLEIGFNISHLEILDRMSYLVEEEYLAGSTLCSCKRDSNCDFTSESYNGPPDYWVTKHKHGSSCADVELESNVHDIAPNAAVLRSGRRKTLNDELPSLHHLSLRRRLSPGGRDRPTTRGIRRNPRNISPSRCNDEDCSDLIGLQHDEKYMRDFL
ncbi:uncharacterized protein Fot_30988 [Forsythia ovata]|uniref:Uncharacterized protein n=1 Tax=Forsythia ovata TaxID=205694 RepID=A0ABD1T3Y1_9LAMI